MKAAGIPTERVWTVVDGEHGAIYACAGYRVVNRVAYMVTEEPWTSDMTVATLQEEDPDMDSDDED